MVVIFIFLLSCCTTVMLLSGFDLIAISQVSYILSVIGESVSLAALTLYYCNYLDRVEEDKETVKKLQSDNEELRKSVKDLETRLSNCLVEK